MFQRSYSALLSGLSGIIVQIECFIGSGLPSFTIVGLPATPALSARERIRSALKCCGYPLPPSRITINIRPLHTCDQLGPTGYEILDLPIALAILACQGHLSANQLCPALFLGELSLDGNLRPLNGALTLSYCAQEAGFSKLYLPVDNAAEAALSAHGGLCALTSLPHAVDVLRGRCPGSSFSPAKPEKAPILLASFDTIRGQDIGKRALTVAAAGMHNLLFIGPPGCGKTLLSRTLPALLPPLTRTQQIELTQIYSASGLLSTENPLIQERPFRTPHHSIPATSLIGGGAWPRPGEITLAHHGVLYLDELPEFSRAALESLRQPLEEHSITISRLRTGVRLPADFLLIASMNPCPCGYYPDSERCFCGAARIRQYYGKLSSPLLDRIDLVVQLQPVPLGRLTENQLRFAQAQELVQLAHEMQALRFFSNSFYNSRMTPEQISEHCSLAPELSDFMLKAYEHYHLTMRTYHKVLKISRTLADLDGCQHIELSHITEALQYRLPSHIEMPGHIPPSGAI